MAKLKPHDVYTPRSASVNERMYVPRPELERRLKGALNGAMHIVIHGESGTGKSWLFKRVLEEVGARYLPMNMANALRLGSIQAEVENALARRGNAKKVAYQEEKSAEVNTLVAKGGVNHTGEYEIGQMEPFEACCKMLREEAGKGPACLVFDNLEMVFDNEKMMGELAGIITLMDDERYAQYAVKILLVGTPADIRDYFNRTPNRATIANRLTELPEVSRLSDTQAGEVVRRGFEEELKYSVGGSLQETAAHVSWVTTRIPQKVQEYCLELALVAEENAETLTDDSVLVADQHWLSGSLANSYSLIENCMNERETKIGRRNQILWALGTLDGDEIRLADVEERVRGEFPNSTAGKTLDISGLLARFARDDSRLLRRSPKGDSYRFADPAYRMCIRVMLAKDPDDETIVKRDFEEVLG